MPLCTLCQHFLEERYPEEELLFQGDKYLNVERKPKG